jgi:regulator of sigma E protease
MTVRSVAPGGAAEKAGLRVGDRIIAVDEAPIAVEALLPAAVLRAESEVKLEVVRGEAEPETIAVALGGRPVELGLSWREDAAAPGAVYVTRVVPYSPADRAGVRLYDRIYAIDGEPFADQDDLLEKVRARLADAEAIHFEVETAGRVHSVEVNLKLPSADKDDVSL